MIPQCISAGYLSVGAVLVITLLLVPAPGSGDPTITIAMPQDGSWTTCPDIVLKGTAAPGPPLDVTVPIADLGQVAGHAIKVEGGAVVLRPVCIFSEDFDGVALDTDVWTEADTAGRVALEDGALVLETDTGHSFPLLQSAALTLPDADWIAGFRTKNYDDIWTGSVGGGVTGSDPTAATSHAAAMLQNDEAHEQAIVVYASGNPVQSTNSDWGWHTYTLEHTLAKEGSAVTMDGTTEGSVHITSKQVRFWFGRGITGEDTIYPVLYVDFADIWTFSGDWTSAPYDLGARVVLERASPGWGSTDAGRSCVAFEVRTSLDAREWSGWTVPQGGRLDPPVECQYVQFRLQLSMPGVKDEAASLRVASVGLRYASPLVGVEVRAPGGNWTPVGGTGAWSARVTLQEGPNVVEARAVDTFGSAVAATVNVTLDTTPPVGTVSVRGPRPYTNDANITLLLDAQDAYGVVSIGVSSYPDFYQERVLPYATELPWRIQGGLGVNTVYVRFYDAHGLVSAPMCATVAFDPFPPSGHVVIDGGARYTQGNVVRLDLDSSDEVGMLSVELSNDPGMADARPIPVGTRSVEGWALAEGGDGPRTVHMRLTDLAGNVAVVNASIELYVPKALGRVSIEGGAAVTNRTVVRVRIDAPAELRATTMQLSQDPGFAGAKWEDVAAERLFILAPGDGEARIYARFTDFRGFISLPVSGSIVLDTTPPALAVLVDGGAMYTTDATVSVSVSYDDSSPAGRMWRCADGRFDLAEPTPFEGLFDWTVPAAEGDWRVHVMVEDAAGNVAVAVATVHFATVRPPFTVSFPGGTTSNATSRFQADITWTDPYGGVEMQIALDADPPGMASWQSAGGPVWVDVPAGAQDGGHLVHARARNAAGLVSDVLAWHVALDRTPPRISLLEPADGAVLHQTGLGIQVRVGVEDPSGVASASFRLDGGEWLPLDDLANLTGRTTAKGFGAHTLEVRVTDAVGNTGTEAATFELARSGQSLPSGGAISMVMALATVITAVALAAWLSRRRGGTPPQG
jgi:hypothetical protein